MSQPGIHHLLTRSLSRIKGRKVALLSHQPAIDKNGTSTAELLHRHPEVHLHCLLGPEHGYFGEGRAGQKLKSFKHPDYKVPVYSLYGSNRSPTQRMFKDVDVLVVDLCDLGIRTYTYVSTLVLCLEAAAESGIPVIVCDRPVPQPFTVDGPLLRPDCRSFVSQIDAPMVYGMTPGETASWYMQHSAISGDLHVCKMSSYTRDSCRKRETPTWIPPSPAIRSWASSLCYAATVFTEAFEDLDCNRHGAMPFQVIGAPWLAGSHMAEMLNEKKLSGVSFEGFYYLSGTHQKNVQGLRLNVHDPKTFMPIETSMHILSALMSYSKPSLRWGSKYVRPDFFDKLYGTTEIREQLDDECAPGAIIDQWKPGNRSFKRARSKSLLYENKA